MADINDIKGTLLNTLGTVAEKTRSFAGKAADKAKDVARIAKLNMEMGAEKDNIQKAYLEIGKIYYEMHKDDPDSFFIQLCDEIALANDSLAKLRAELDDLKASLTAKGVDIEVELSEIKLEDDFIQEAQETVEEVIETVAETAEDVVEAVSDTVEEVVEAIEEKIEND